MSLADSIFIFGLALIIFGPKKLPEIGRQIGKIMLEFRRASNEFKMQIEEELRTVEQADRQKQIADSAAKDPIPPPDASVASSSESLTLRPPSTGTIESTDSPYKPVSEPSEPSESYETAGAAESEPDSAGLSPATDSIPPSGAFPASSSGSLSIRPPSADSLYTRARFEEEIAEAPAGRPDPGDLEIAEAARDVPGPVPYVARENEAGERQIGEDRGLQEQITNHHG